MDERGPGEGGGRMVYDAVADTNSRDRGGVSLLCIKGWPKNDGKSQAFQPEMDPGDIQRHSSALLRLDLRSSKMKHYHY